MKKKQKVPKPPTGSTQKSSLRANTNSTDNISKSIRTSRPFLLPAYVRAAIQKLYDSGYIAYVVGGSVRDFLLGREIKDHDIATSADPQTLCKIFPNAVTVGKAFGVIKVPTNTQPPLLEIATFRKDLEYEDYRRPKGVVFSNPVEDAFRRDFTVNALFYDPKTSLILDVTGLGLQDLKDKVIRAIGIPQERFEEDALRLLRAIRFKTNLGFELHKDTAAAIRLKARLITRVSAERVRDELTQLWTGPQPAVGLEMMVELGLLKLILPEIDAIREMKREPNRIQSEERLWKHLLRVLATLAEQNPQRSPTLAWAALLHEVGRPAVTVESGALAGVKKYPAYEVGGAKIAQKITTRLKMSRTETDRISAMVANHLKFKEVFQMRESTLQRFIREEYFAELLALHKADATVLDGNLAFYEFCLSKFKEYQASSKLDLDKILNGDDLIQMGFQPGPLFSEILREVEDLALEKKLTSKEEALDYVLKSYVK